MKPPLQWGTLTDLQIVTTTSHLTQLDITMDCIFHFPSFGETDNQGGNEKTCIQLYQDILPAEDDILAIVVIIQRRITDLWHHSLQAGSMRYLIMIT